MREGYHMYLLHHIEHVAPRLFEGAPLTDHPTRGHELDFRLVGGGNRIEPPVLHLEH